MNEQQSGKTVSQFWPVETAPPKPVDASNKAAAAVRTVMRVPKTGKRAKPKPKYQSKKNRSMKWTGRGMLPTWMREEMKGTKLTKENFLIK